MSIVRLLPLLLLIPAMALADSDKNYKVASNQFVAGSVVEPIANMVIEAKGTAVVSQKPSFPLKNFNLYWRHKKGPREYVWIQGKPDFTNYVTLHAFSLAEAHLLPSEVAYMRFYAAQNLKAFQDETDIYFDKYYLYSPRVPRLFFMKNGRWQVLREAEFPGVVVFENENKDFSAAFKQSPLTKLPKAVFPLKADSYVFTYTAPGFLPEVDICSVASRSVVVLKPELIAPDTASGQEIPGISMELADVKATKNLEETEILYDKFIGELQKVASFVDTMQFDALYPKLKTPEFLGLDKADFNYKEYKSAYEGTRMKAKSDWMHSMTIGVSEVNAAFNNKLDSLQALPLRVALTPVSVTPVRATDSSVVDSASAPLKAVMLKFGQSHERIDVAWQGTAKDIGADSLYKLFEQNGNDVPVIVTIEQNKPVWLHKESEVSGRHHYRYTQIEFKFGTQSLAGVGEFILPAYISAQPEVQRWLSVAHAAPWRAPQEILEAAGDDSASVIDGSLPGYDNAKFPRIVRDTKFGTVALIDSGTFRYRGRVVSMSPFAIMTTEVTQNLFAQWMLAQEDSLKRIKDRSSFRSPFKPVHNITWDNARAACQMMGGDLPTEAQWEFAGRADNNEGAVWEGDPKDSVGNYAVYRNNSYKMGKKSDAYGPQKVASKKPNAWGIYDMSGNVAEWTRDKYFMFSLWVESSNPTGAVMGYSKVYKGGSWKDNESALNLTNGDDEDPRYWSDAIGFRCVFPRKLIEGR
ncbi:MAG: SUMF1/EgtB/PvdO family nonheme iron enzyme [Fibrobacter sp.]|uniref:formylglycine-generating enzyme family protein n=1 Tax=Fibrobacter sp. TaxID=35828 RepID=UPI0025B98878|nr:SUMF1/EgtB/PvdO family nonheme iron enzyme [Fibrobacter sp.]MBR4785406.1 SUMF1/EgtB/PvdO family nonheme iron enzyme [Fibrobacter sp.]